MSRTSDYQPLYGDQQYWQIARDGQSQPQRSHPTGEGPPVFAENGSRPDVFRNVDGHSQQLKDNDQNQPRGSRDAVKNPEPESTAQHQTSRLGWLIKLSIITSLLALSVAVGLLSWLWWTPQEDAAWRAWVLIPNRLQLTITLASVCIRTAVGILASISTAMLASVAVETGGVYLPDVAQVSITRFASSGPLSLVLVGLRGSLAEKRMRFLLLLLVITTFAAQFSSTLLLSDLAMRPISSFPGMFPVVFGLDDDGVPVAFREIARQDGMHSSFRQPTFSPLFAEYSLPSIRASGVDDTGLSVRAFLPFRFQEVREALSEFTGMSHVFDSRVICVAPKVENLGIDTFDKEGLGVEPVRLASGIHGNISFDRDILDKANIGNAPTSFLSFSCSLISSMEVESSEKIWAICRYTQLGNTFHHPSFVQDHDVWSPMRLLWDGANSWRDPEQPGMRNGSFYRGTELLNLTTTTSGQWVNIILRGLAADDGAKLWEMRFKMTACFTPLLSSYGNESVYYNISAVSLNHNGEPYYEWDSQSQSYSEQFVLWQLGLFPTWSKRPVMSLSPEITQPSVAGASITNETTGLFHAMEAWPDRDIAFCLFCSAANSGVMGVDVIYTSLFNDAMENTDSPAQALQAVRFVRAREWYYALMDAYARESMASITFLETTLVPYRGKGYWWVMGILGVFVATFATVGLWFRSTHNSLPENAWHTIAQLSESPEISQVLRQSTLATDAAVERLIDGTGHPVGFAGHVDSFSAAIRRFWKEVVAATTFRPRNNKPRFVVRDGVFVHASGAEKETDTEGMELRLRSKASKTTSQEC